MITTMCDSMKLSRHVLYNAFSQTSVQVLQFIVAVENLEDFRAIEKDNADFLCLKDYINIFYQEQIKVLGTQKCRNEFNKTELFCAALMY